MVGAFLTSKSKSLNWDHLKLQRFLRENLAGYLPCHTNDAWLTGFDRGIANDFVPIPGNVVTVQKWTLSKLICGWGWASLMCAVSEDHVVVLCLYVYLQRWFSWGLWWVSERNGPTLLTKHHTAPGCSTTVCHLCHPILLIHIFPPLVMVQRGKFVTGSYSSDQDYRQIRYSLAITFQTHL